MLPTQPPSLPSLMYNTHPYDKNQINLAIAMAKNAANFSLNHMNTGVNKKGVVSSSNTFNLESLHSNLNANLFNSTRPQASEQLFVNTRQVRPSTELFNRTKKSFDQNLISKSINLLLTSLKECEIKFLVEKMSRNENDAFFPSVSAIHYSPSFWRMLLSVHEPSWQEKEQICIKNSLDTLERQIFASSYFPPIRSLSQTCMNLEAVIWASRTEQLFGSRKDHPRASLVKQLLDFALIRLAKRIELIEQKLISNSV